MQARGKRVLVVITATALGGAIGVAVALSRGGSSGSPSASGGSAAAAADPSRYESVTKGFYLSRLRNGRIEVDAMTPLLLSPVKSDEPSPRCPPRLVITTEEGYAPTILPWVEAIGQMPFELNDRPTTLSDVLGTLDGTWRTLRSIAMGPVGVPPLRVFVKHYPATDLPGRCISVVITFYTCADPAVESRYSQPSDLVPGRVRGVLFEIMRTVRLDGPSPRLLAATVESHAQLEILPMTEVSEQRLELRQIVDAPEIGRIASNRTAKAHFGHLGGGRRCGLAWFDLSLGDGDPQPWSCAYATERRGVDAPNTSWEKGLPEPVAEALLALVSRS